MNSIAPVRLVVPLLLSCALLFSCATKRVAPPDADMRAAEAWRAFQDSSVSNCPTGSFRLRGSLNYVTPGRKGRAVMTLWGNVGGAVRMDAASTFGSVELLLREEGDEILAYVPSERTAYIGLGKEAALGNLGVPAAPSLQDIAVITLGCYHRLLPESYTDVEFPTKDTIHYLFDDERIASVTLAEGSTLERMAGSSDPAWTLEFQDRDDEDAPAGRLVFSQGEDTLLTLRIREKKTGQEPLPPKGLLLSLPPGTTLK